MAGALFRPIMRRERPVINRGGKGEESAIPTPFKRLSGQKTNARANDRYNRASLSRPHGKRRNGPAAI